MTERNINKSEYDQILSHHSGLEVVTVDTGRGTLIVHTPPNTPANDFVVKAHHGDVSEYWVNLI